MSFSRQYLRGLTLVELLVTLSIAAVMLAIAAPSFRDFVQRSQLSSEVNGLSLVLMYARSESIKRGHPVTLCKTSDPLATPPACDSNASWHSGWLVFVNRNGELDTDDSVIDSTAPADEVLRVGAATKATVSGGAGFDNYVTFRPLGTVKGSGNSGQADNGSFTVTIGSLEKLVCINTTGRTEIATGTCP